MPKFSANLTMLFNEVDFLDRYERAAKNGFTAVEFMFPYAWPAEQLAEKLERFSLRQVLHNLPAGDWAAGERGLACIPGREQEFREGVGMALDYARALKCPALNCLAGLTPTAADPDKVIHTLVENLRFAAQALADAGIKLLVEPLNNKDIPGFYLVNSNETVVLMDEVAHTNLYLQYDIYHMQRMEGDLAHTIKKLASRIGHMQLADNPGRHEPGTGEINFANLFKEIDKAGYDGWIGCEYIPAGDTEAGLGWMALYQ